MSFVKNIISKKFLYRLLSLFMALVLCLTIVIHNTHKVEAVVFETVAVAAAVTLLIGAGFIVTKNLINQLTDGSSALNQEFEEEYGKPALEFVSDNTFQAPDPNDNSGNSKLKTFIKSSAAVLFINTLLKFFKNGLIDTEENEDGTHNLIYSNAMPVDDLINYTSNYITSHYKCWDSYGSVHTVENMLKSSTSNLISIRLFNFNYNETVSGKTYTYFGVGCVSVYANNVFYVRGLEGGTGYVGNKDSLCGYKSFSSNDFELIYNFLNGYASYSNWTSDNYYWVTDTLYNSDYTDYDDTVTKTNTIPVQPDNIINNQPDGETSPDNNPYYQQNIQNYYITNPVPDVDPEPEVLPLNIPTIDPETEPTVEPEMFPYTDPAVIFDPDVDPYSDPDTEPSSEPVSSPESSDEVITGWQWFDNILNAILNFLKAILDAIKGLVTGFCDCLSDLFIPTDLDLSDMIAEELFRYIPELDGHYFDINGVEIPDVTYNGVTYINNKYIRNHMSNFRLVLQIFISFLYVMHLVKKVSKSLDKG